MMSKLKRIISFVVAVAIMFSMTAFTTASETPSISAEQKTAAAGSEVQIALNIKNNPGIAGLAIAVEYSSGLTLVKAEDRNLLGDKVYGGNVNANPYNLTWNNFEADVFGDGTFTVLTFKVSADAKVNDVLYVKLTVKEAYNNADEDHTFTVTNGTITVVCEHSWDDADCENPKTCNKCQATEGTALGHDFRTEWTKDETGHWHICSRCDTKGSFTAHTKQTVPAVAPSCTVDGKTAGEKCSVCDYVIKAQETDPKLNHSFTNYTSNNDAKCGVDGTKTATCDNGCGSKDTKTDEGSALEHKYTNYTSNNDAKCGVDGTKTATCDNGCGSKDTKADVGSALEHKFTKYESNKDATCTADGTKTATCDNGCGTTDTVADAGSKLEHDYAPATCTAPQTCTCGATKGEALGHDMAPATCTAPKTCKRCGTTEGEALGHKYTNYVSNNDAKCGVDGTKTATCDNGCGTKDTVTDKDSALKHSYTKYASNGDATCTADGTKTAVCDNGCGTKDTVADTGSKLGHSYSTEWSKDATNHYHACSRCDSKVDTAAHTYKDDKDDTCEVCNYNRGHIHSLTKVGAVAATCTESGNKEYYICSDSDCGAMFEDAAGKTEITDKNSVVIKATGHTYEKATWTWEDTIAASVSVACSACDNKASAKATVTSEVTTAATCTTNGVLTYTATATVGGKTFTDTKTEAIEATGHNFKNGKCTVCETADPDYVAPTDPTEPPATEPPVTEPPVTEPPVTEPPVTEPPVTEPPVTEPPVTEPPHTHSFGAWVVVKDPTSQEAGKEERTCACGEKETREIPKLSNPFKDVNSKNYYYEPVLWAVNKGITAGTEKDAFGPNDPCTRAQIVTFLWRAAGSPEPKADAKNPFSDVKATDYYYKAVLWAVEKGITSGVSADKFGSGAVCTRAQVVTFLWRAAGSPEAKGTNPFTDVKTTDYYCQAVLWAVEKGITAGTSATTFGSSENCVRGQIVTFLYKAYAK